MLESTVTQLKYTDLADHLLIKYSGFRTGRLREIMEAEVGTTRE